MSIKFFPRPHQRGGRLPHQTAKLKLLTALGEPQQNSLWEPCLVCFCFL